MFIWMFANRSSVETEWLFHHFKSSVKHTRREHIHVCTDTDWTISNFSVQTYTHRTRFFGLNEQTFDIRKKQAKIFTLSQIPTYDVSCVLTSWNSRLRECKFYYNGFQLTNKQPHEVDNSSSRLTRSSPRSLCQTNRHFHSSSQLLITTRRQQKPACIFSLNHIFIELIKNGERRRWYRRFAGSVGLDERSVCICED